MFKLRGSFYNPISLINKKSVVVRIKEIAENFANSDYTKARRIVIYLTTIVANK